MGFSKKKIAEIEEKARKKCEKKAKEAEKKMATKYTELVDSFYEEYDPYYYVRHHEKGFSNRGLDLAMQKIFKDESKGKNKKYTGGIILNTDKMYDDYSGTQEQVLYSFLAGYHGLPIYQRQGTGLKSIDKNWYHGNSNGFVTSNTHPAEELQRYLDKILIPELRKEMDINVLDD